MKSDASLKGKIKALAKQSGLKPQELLQMYLFEHLLIRLERSDYAETFVLKGGLLISSMTGVSQRPPWTWTPLSSEWTWTRQR